MGSRATYPMLALLALLAMLATPPSAAHAACAKSAAIQQAFRPNIEYQAKRARVYFGDDRRKQILSRFNGIRANGETCQQLYARYKQYLDEVTRRNDAAANSGILQFQFKRL